MKFRHFLFPTGPFIWNRWYEQRPDFVRAYNLLNYRNHVTLRKSYFVVLAKTQSDVIESVKFAASHNLGISIFSTGHEFNDRNSGPGPNTLLIRTTCLRKVQFDLDKNNRFSHPDGIVRLETGLTWGTSKLDYKGFYYKYLTILIYSKNITDIYLIFASMTLNCSLFLF